MTQLTHFDFSSLNSKLSIIRASRERGVGGVTGGGGTRPALICGGGGPVLEEKKSLSKTVMGNLLKFIKRK